MKNRLKISENGHYFQDAENIPFFWLGDTGWLMMTELTRDEMDLYLRRRSEQGFNVINCMAVPDAGVNPTKGGHFAFLDAFDITTPNEDYFKELDFIVERSAAYGLYLCLLPLFGSWDIPKLNLNSETAYQYGYWLGSRYNHMTHLIWVLGGDIYPERIPEGRECFDRMAEGIKGSMPLLTEDDWKKKCIMSYHPAGFIPEKHSSSLWFHDSPWLAYNAIQTYCFAWRVPNEIERDYRLLPSKPVVMAEPNYEGPLCYTQVSFQQYDHYRFPLYTSRQAWWSFLCGAAGYFLGNNHIWNFGRILKGAWQDHLDDPGVKLLLSMKHILVSLKWYKFEPCPQILGYNNDNRDPDMLPVAAIDRPGHRALVYIPLRKTPDSESVRRKLVLRTKELPDKVKAWWIHTPSGQRISADFDINWGLQGILDEKITEVQTPAGDMDDILLLIEG